MDYGVAERAIVFVGSAPPEVVWGRPYHDFPAGELRRAGESYACALRLGGEEAAAERVVRSLAAAGFARGDNGWSCGAFHARVLGRNVLLAYTADASARYIGFAAWPSTVDVFPGLSLQDLAGNPEIAGRLVRVIEGVGEPIGPWLLLRDNDGAARVRVTLRAEGVALGSIVVGVAGPDRWVDVAVCGRSTPWQDTLAAAVRFVCG